MGLSIEQRQVESVPGGPILLFDGDCVMCSRAVRTVARLDKRRVFRFAAQTSDVGRRLLGGGELPGEMVVWEGGKQIGGSDAVLFVARGLGWPWKIAGIAKVLPKSVRDVLYRLVARNRYRLFGKSEACFVPSGELRERFVSDGNFVASGEPVAAGRR
jgi:predicted DCC family thiol-disulfide oxidoreductase YuxK